ncbi:MAG: N-acetylmuramoyl-L-alanine amidase, partial [Syntrophothermus sp.]
MKKIVLIVLSVTFFLSAQSLTGKKFCLDPGHGSTKTETYEPETKRFETWANHIVKPYLKQYLENYGATVFSTRGDFDSLAYHTTLSEREAVANNNNVDYFQSIHHNAFNGASNYSLVLFEQLNANDCPVGNPQWPGQSDVMANIMVNKIQQALQTTAAYPRGDFCFLGYNLGVLNDLTMPGTLSESSFFDNLAERQRLSNLEYLRTEAEALFLSFLQYYNVAAPSHGSLVGFVKTPAGVPINGVSIIIESVNKTYLTDNLGNGFYRIDSLAPGTYTIKAFTTTDTLTSSAVVAGGKINVKNLSFQLSVGDVKMYAVLSQGDGIKARWLVPEGSVDSYYVYISTDGINFNSEPDYKTVNDNYTITGLTSGQSYYVKVKGKNSKGLSINFSKTYGAQVSSSSDKVLIVDGFSRYGGTGSYPTPDHNLLRLYGKSMDNLGMRYDAVSNSAIVAASILTQYKYVIWFTGDESTIDETFTTAEQNILKSYLNGGGKLFVTGSEIAWDLGNKGAVEDKDFFNNYLKSNYVADNPTPNTPSAFGNTGSIFDSITVSFGNTYP